jgi:hypothetical protein
MGHFMELEAQKVSLPCAAQKQVVAQANVDL